MSTLPSNTFWEDKVQRNAPEQVEVFLLDTSGTVTTLSAFVDVGTIFGTAANLGRSSAAALQAEVNAALSDGQPVALSPTSTAEVDVSTVFATTPMGVDSIGLVLPMAGQVRRVVCLTASLSGSASITIQPAALSATLATPGLAVTPLGNIISRFVLTGLDAGTGVVTITVRYQSK